MKHILLTNDDGFDAIGLKVLIEALKPLATKPKVLFIYARGAGNLMVAGKNTPVEKQENRITIAAT